MAGSNEERTRPSEEFGRKAVDLARQAGFSAKDLADAVGKSLASIERLQQGKGSMEVGIRVKRYLASNSIDVSSLPPLDATGSDPKIEEWALEWLRIGGVLREHAKPEWWAFEFEKLKRMADAFEVQARELKELSRVK